MLSLEVVGSNPKCLSFFALTLLKHACVILLWKVKPVLAIVDVKYINLSRFTRDKYFPAQLINYKMVQFSLKLCFQPSFLPLMGTKINFLLISQAIFVFFMRLLLESVIHQPKKHVRRLTDFTTHTYNTCKLHNKMIVKYTYTKSSQEINIWRHQNWNPLSTNLRLLNTDQHLNSFEYNGFH